MWEGFVMGVRELFGGELERGFVAGFRVVEKMYEVGGVGPF
jgi:hypothetical protein